MLHAKLQSERMNIPIVSPFVYYYGKHLVGTYTAVVDTLYSTPVIAEVKSKSPLYAPGDVTRQRATVSVFRRRERGVKGGS